MNIIREPIERFGGLMTGLSEVAIPGAVMAGCTALTQMVQSDEGLEGYNPIVNALMNGAAWAVKTHPIFERSVEVIGDCYSNSELKWGATVLGIMWGMTYGFLSAGTVEFPNGDVRTNPKTTFMDKIMHAIVQGIAFGVMCHLGMVTLEAGTRGVQTGINAFIKSQTA